MYTPHGPATTAVPPGAMSSPAAPCALRKRWTRVVSGRAMVQRALTTLFACCGLVVTQCRALPPSGVFGCTNDAECPAAMRCAPDSTCHHPWELPQVQKPAPSEKPVETATAGAGAGGVAVNAAAVPMAGSTVAAAGTTAAQGPPDAGPSMLPEPDCNADPCPAQVLRESVDLGTDLIVDRSNLYWITADARRLMRMAKSGGDPVELARYEQEVRVGGLLADESFVYLADARTGDVHSYAVDGSSATLIDYDHVGIHELAADGAFLFWITDFKRIYKQAKPNSLPAQIKSFMDATDLAESDVYVYVSSSSAIGINKLQKTTNEASVLTTAQAVAGLVVYNGRLYYGTQDGFRSMSVNGGAETTLFSAAYTRDRNFIMDGGDVYWRTDAGLVRYRAEVGAKPQPIMVANPTSIRTVSVDASHVYVGAEGRIYRVAKPSASR